MIPSLVTTDRIMEYRMKGCFVVYSIVPIDPANLPPTVLSRIHPDGNIVCPFCGVKATHVGIWRHKNEGGTVRHISYLYPIKDNPEILHYMTVDHILPKSLKGRDNITNLRAMCYPCNTNRKNNMSNRDIVEVLSNVRAHVTNRNIKHLGIQGQNRTTHPLAEWKNIFDKYPELELQVRFQ